VEGFSSLKGDLHKPILASSDVAEIGSSQFMHPVPSWAILAVRGVVLSTFSAG
jgi:hypothetical protein